MFWEECPSRWKLVSPSKTINSCENVHYKISDFRRCGWSPNYSNRFLDSKKGIKINVHLRMKNVATTWSKMESFFMKKCEIEADHNLVWACHAVTKTRFLFVSRQNFKIPDYIRNEWFFNNFEDFERFRLRCHVPRRGAWHRRRNLSKSSLPASFQSENSFFSLVKFLLRRHTPRGCILVTLHDIIMHYRAEGALSSRWVRYHRKFCFCPVALDQILWSSLRQDLKK